CGIIGNPSDLYGGAVISCSLKQRATAVLKPSDRLRIRSGSLCGVVNGPEDLAKQGDYLDVVRVVLTQLWDELPHRSFSLECDTDIPPQSGLAGSSALLAALTGAVLKFVGKDLCRHEIAELVHDIEWHLMDTACGYQDHYVEIFGGLNFMDFRGKENLGRCPEKEPFATVEPLLPFVTELPFVLASTGVQRNSGQVHKPLRQRWEEGDQEVISAYRRIAQLAALGKRALLQRDWKTLGTYMNENHEIQRSLGGSHPACDALIEAARKAGAFGAKLAGAGHGGTIIALHPDRYAMAESLRQAGAFRIILPEPGEGLVVEVI
ncbi:MAG: GHMP family kinase ATP-binding protein, partial [Armatimonadota bacterium]